MAVEAGTPSGTIAAKPTIDVRALVEKVAKERAGGAAAPPQPSSAAPAPAAEPPKPQLDPEIAVQLERTKAEAEIARTKLANYEAEIARLKAEDERAKGDWQYALQRYGYKPEDVLPSWIEGGQAKPSMGQPDPQAELVQRLAKLEGVITTAQSESVRERRMREVRQAMGDETSEDYAVMRTIGADQSFLDTVLAEEQRRGVPVGQAELAKMLKEHENKARGVVRPQFERLAKSQWGKDLLKEILAEAAKTVDAGSEPSAPAEEPKAPVLGADKPRITLGRDMNAIIEAAKRKALAGMQRTG